MPVIEVYVLRLLFRSTHLCGLSETQSQKVIIKYSTVYKEIDMKKIILLLIISMVILTDRPAYAMELIGGAGAGAEDIVMSVSSGSADQAASEKAADIGIKLPQISESDTDKTIKEGVFVGTVNVSGKTHDEAVNAVNSYVSELGNTDITLVCVSGNTVSVHASELGLHWTNTDVIEDAVSLGRSGNVIKRFKEVADLKRTNKVYELALGIDEELAGSVIASKCTTYDVEALNATMTRSNDAFQITAGHDGLKVNVDESVRAVADEVSSKINGDPLVINLVVDVDKPKGDAETLGRLTDVLGRFTTKFYSSGKDRVTNVANGCRLINGTLLYPGEQISVSQTISPMTEENGYALAGSYLNGLVVESFGGGICQVSTTLYQAVLRAELQVDERYNHSMVVNYVDHSGDAAIAEGIKDFKFTNNLDNPIYIDGYTTPDKTITFTIYGVETRPSNRTLEFESVDLEEMEPEGEKVVEDSSLPAGSTRKQSAHTGYRSELYKIVKVDGVETDRVLVNRSTYKAVPAILTVGTATDDPNVKAILKDAISTQNIEYCMAIASGQVPPQQIDPNAAAMAALLAAQAAAEQTTVENPPD